MDYLFNKHSILAWIFIGLFLGLVNAQEGKSLYPVEPVYTPELQRPKIDTRPQMLAKGSSGKLPEYDGEIFRINPQSSPAAQANAREAEALIQSTLAALGLEAEKAGLKAGEIRMSGGVDKAATETVIREAQQQTRRSLEGRYGQLNPATEEMLREQEEFARQLMSTQQKVFRYDQFYRGIPVENSGLRVIWRSGQGFTGITGRVFAQIKVDNTRRLNARAAKSAAKRHFQRKTDVSEISDPEVVLLPYADGFRYAWKMVVQATEGPYLVWIDATNGKVLQLDPQFFYDSARGLVFDPNPNVDTTIMSFEVDPPSGGNYSLQLSGVLSVSTNGADSVCTTNLTIPDDGSGLANFNVNPLNGLAVNRTSDANYNCRFQEINAYAWIYNHIQTITTNLGGQPLPSITTTVNHNNPCGFGINNACANSGSFSLTFGIGGATISNSNSCNQLFNSAIDATVITHEFGHLVNANQYAVSGGSMTGAINEGMADFWAYTLHNTNTFGAFWNNNCPAPVQSSFVPRQAEAQDIFPEHRINFGDGFPHTDGQIISWALWDGRREFSDISALGVLIYNMNFLTAQTTAGVGVSTGSTFRRVHDSFVDLLQQFAPLFNNNRLIHKLLSGFARAGIFLAPKDAIIDINDDFLNRNDANGPTFTVWTGRDYTFFANGNVNTGNQPFNTRFTVEVANDEAFTVNLVSSGVQSGVVSGAGGVGSWTMPTSDWNTLKAADQIFYRVTTTTNTGGSVRSSANPGNSFLTGVPPAKATINESGACECACGASAASRPGMAMITLLPLFVAFIWRRKIKSKRK